MTRKLTYRQTYRDTDRQRDREMKLQGTHKCDVKATQDLTH